MFKRLLLWLVTRFLTIRDISGYVVKHAFLKNPTWVVQEMINQGNKLHTPPNGFPKSMTQFSANALLHHLGYSGSLYILTLLKIKEYVCYCSPDCNEEALTKFFKDVQAIKEENANPLKLRKELTGYIIANLKMAGYSETIDIVNVLTQQHLHQESAVKFLTTGV